MGFSNVHQELRRWYGYAGRVSLPWRNTSDPYHIYLSEMMLQQTQVKTVLERYYHPFLERFPSLLAIQEAHESEVLKLWEGLGYYRRARYIYATAQLVDVLPQSREELMALPGIGKNTAHAIMAFAYKSPVPVMEANVKRIMARFFAIEQPKDAMLWSLAFELLDQDDPFTYNQALMDIGALVCTARVANCDICPLQIACKGKHDPYRYPAAVVKSKKPVRKSIFVIRQNSNDQVYLVPRTSNFLHGMYRFEEKEVVPDNAVLLGKVRQHYSHFTLDASVYFLRSDQCSEQGGQWMDMSTLNQLPMSEIDKKMHQLLASD